MKLKFEYSIKSETARVKETIARRNFYKDHGYHVLLPQGWSLEKVKPRDLRVYIEKEFKKEEFDEVKIDLIKQWSEEREKVEHFLRKVFYKKPEEILVILTRYGSGGSYFLPNKIVINIKYDNNYFESLIHELIHLVIEMPVIKQFNLGQSSKESLVDYLLFNDDNLKKLFPKYRYQDEKPSKDLLKRIGWLDRQKKIG